MLRDARELDDAGTIECDLCIIGGGAAGITIARSFAGGTLKVCLLESGGLEYEAEIQALYQGQNVGLPYFDLDVCRLRFFGGSTNHWAGRCRPLDELDFAPRPWVPLSGWPIDKADARAVLSGGAGRSASSAPTTTRPSPGSSPASRSCRSIPRSSSAGSGSSARRRCSARSTGRSSRAPPTSTSCCTRAWSRSSPSESGAEVQSVALRDARRPARHGARARLRAGLRRAREPAPAARLQPPGQPGLGKQHDMVGRCFMEHPHMNAARALVTDPAVLAFYTRGQGGGSAQGLEVVGCLNLSPARQQAQQVLNFDSLFTVDNIGDSGYAALRRIWNAAEQGAWPDDLAGDLWQALIDIDDTAAGLMGRFGLREYRADNASFLMWCSAEQAPNPDSRVRARRRARRARPAADRARLAPRPSSTSARCRPAIRRSPRSSAAPASAACRSTSG